MKIALMIGSIRKERTSDKPAQVLLRKFEQKDVEVILLDLQKLELPLFDDGIKSSGKNELLQAYREVDGIVIVCPEYNHSMSSSVKNAIDYARKGELLGKPLTVCTVSIGLWGGARALEPLQNTWLGVGGVALPVALHTSLSGQFNEDDLNVGWEKGADNFVEQSIKWFQIIKQGKELYEKN